jgi:hypothetical protein
MPTLKDAMDAFNEKNQNRSGWFGRGKVEREDGGHEGFGWGQGADMYSEAYYRRLIESGTASPDDVERFQAYQETIDRENRNNKVNRARDNSGRTKVGEEISDENGTRSYYYKDGEIVYEINGQRVSYDEYYPNG